MNIRSFLSSTFVAVAVGMAKLQPVEAGLAGAFGAISDLEDAEVVECAQYAVVQLYSVSALETTGSKGDSVPPYSFLQHAGTADLLKAQQYTVRVVEGSQQVVAGMNYRITVMMTDDVGACLGSFRVIIYDHFGEKSVTMWGEEVSCDLALELVAEETDGDDEDDNQDGGDN